MSFRSQIDPDVYDRLVKELVRRRDLAVRRTLDNAASGTIEGARFQAGQLKTYDEVLALLEDQRL